MEGCQCQHRQVSFFHVARAHGLIGIGSVSTADGSALIRMGDTTMVCGIKAEIAEPDAARPNEGFISRPIHRVL